MKIRIKFLALLILFVLHSAIYGQISQTKLDALQQSLEEIVGPVNRGGITVSAKVLHADFNKVLYEFKPGESMIPASITKLVTACCAFTKLGQSYSIPTIIYTDDNNISGGVINGNLYLKGFGDPDLSSSDISNLAALFIAKNITKITGNIVADESYFDSQYKGLSGYYSGDTGPSYWPYVSALCLDKSSGAVSAGNLLSAILKSGGVQVDGTVISGVTPAGTKEICKVEHTLFDVLANMCKESDNQSAITMFKLVGAKNSSDQGSLKTGQEAVEKFLNEVGVNRYSYEILEGSGLTRYNKVNADMYIKMLKYMYDDRFLFDYFMNALAVAGKDGTLKNRMIGTAAEGNVHAKTGTLNGVSALSGYVIDADNEILIFFIDMNGFGGNANSMRSIQDDFAVTLANFSRK